MYCVAHRPACRYYLSWRNASFNGAQLSEGALAQLQAYAMPTSGSLRLDYVSYQVCCLCTACHLQCAVRA